jgi:hypothetical protein
VNSSLKKQHGFLMVVAVILIAVVAVIGLLLDYMFIGNITAATVTLQSDQAFYIATSGLEMAKRGMIKNGSSCTTINTNYGTPQSLFTGHVTTPNVLGQFTVSCTAMASGTMASAINASQTTIPLPSVVISQLSTCGAISIDKEVIAYYGISGNNITSASRGASGTSAASHAIGASINLNAYTLTSVGAIPSISTSQGKRTLTQNLFFGSGNIFNLPGGIAPAITVAGSTVVLSGSSNITNNSCGGIKGCSFATTGGISFSGSLTTNDGTSCPLGSGTCHYGSDVLQNYNAGAGGIDPNNFYNYFFSTPLATLISNATTTTMSVLGPNSSGTFYINGSVVTSGSQSYFTNTTSPTTLIINGSLTIAGGTNTTFGNSNGPVTIIVLGDINVSGANNLTGFLYTNGQYIASGTQTIDGALAAKGNYILSGTSNITFDSGILSQLGFGGGNPYSSSTPEVF